MSDELKDDLITQTSLSNDEFYKAIREFYSNENIDTKFELPNKKMTIQLQYSYLIKRIAYYDNLFASKQIIDLEKILNESIAEYKTNSISKNRKSRNEFFTAISSRNAKEEDNSLIKRILNRGQL